MTEPKNATPPASGHRRRPRYPGKNPRTFQERYKERAPEKYPEMEAHIRAQGRTPAGAHVPVLLTEVIACLDPQPGNVVVDCTLGYGGHARAILSRVGAEGRLIGIDTDGEEITRTTARLAGAGTLKTFHTNFAGLGRIVAAEAPGGADVILADLGVSSMQLDDPARGFSYKQSGPLDMRMDHRIGKSAADLLAELPEEELADAFAGLSDEPDAAGIARAILIHRARRPIRDTHDLVRVVFEAKGVPYPWRRRGEQIGGDEVVPEMSATSRTAAVRPWQRRCEQIGGDEVVPESECDEQNGGGSAVAAAGRANRRRRGCAGE